MTPLGVCDIAHNLDFCAEQLELPAMDCEAGSFHVTENPVYSHKMFDNEPSYVTFLVMDDLIVVPGFWTSDANII